MAKKILAVAKVLTLALSAVEAGRQDPINENSNILIVGAGPAGIHMATKLKKLGMSKITILEREHRVGGKSYTIYRDANGQPCEQERDVATGLVNTQGCVAFEMGTCFLHNGYHTIRELVDEYGLTQPIPPEGRAMFSHFAEDQWSAQDMEDFVSSAIMDLYNRGVIRKLVWPLFSTDMIVMDALLTAVAKYNKLHAELVGEGDFSFPNRLDHEDLVRMDMTFAEFLESNDLHALAAFLTFAHAAQGYGYVKSIPAFYGLWWITPELLNGYIQMSMHEKIERCRLLAGASPTGPMKMLINLMTTVLVGGSADSIARTTTMLPEGYGKVWQTMYEVENLNVLFGAEIQAEGIDRQLEKPDSGVKVTYRLDGGKWKTEEYDFLIYTAPHAHSSKYVKDVTISEKAIFGELKSFVLATTMYKSDAVKDYTTPSVHAAIMYNTDKMEDDSVDGTWYADRNDPFIFAHDERRVGQYRVGYQFFESYCKFDPELCDSDRTPDDTAAHAFPVSEKVKNKFLKELEIQRVQNVELVEQFAWPYFHHFPQSAIQNGVPWNLVDMQGSQKTWWLGASACFESVHDVTNYNLMILEKYITKAAEEAAAKRVKQAKEADALKETEAIVVV